MNFPSIDKNGVENGTVHISFWMATGFSKEGSHMLDINMSIKLEQVKTTPSTNQFHLPQMQEQRWG
jgi:hypothetical protein